MDYLLFPVSLMLHHAPLLALAGWFIYLATRHQCATLGVVLGLVVISGTRVAYFNPAVQLGPFSIYPTDFVTAALSAVAAIRLRNSLLRRAVRLPLLALGCLVGLGVSSWTLAVGIEPAADAWRGWLVSLAVAWWALTVPAPWGKRALNVLIGVSSVAALLQCIGFVTYGFRSAGDAAGLEPSVFDGRPISSSVALMVLTGAWALVAATRRWTVPRLLLLMALLVSVLLSQHRSVWIAALLSGMILTIHSSRSRRRLNWQRFSLLSSLGVVAGVAVVQLGKQSNALSSAATDGGTLFWRTTAWQASLSADRSLLEWLAGGALGPTPVFSTDAAVRGVLTGGQHSAYVGATQSVGLVGLAALVWLLLASLRPVSPSESVPSTFCWGVAVGLISFGVFYSVPPWGFLVLGLCWARRRRSCAVTEKGDRRAYGLPPKDADALTDLEKGGRPDFAHPACGTL